MTEIQLFLAYSLPSYSFLNLPLYEDSSLKVANYPTIISTDN